MPGGSTEVAGAGAGAAGCRACAAGRAIGRREIEQKEIPHENRFVASPDTGRGIWSDDARIRGRSAAGVLRTSTWMVC
jgi:hypothetical protein